MNMMVVEQPAWYRPWRLMAFFCTVLFLTWLDLGIFASNPVTGDDDDGNPSGIKKHFGLSGFQLGLLPALYTVGLSIASLVFAEAARTFEAFRILGVGMVLWAAGAVLTGASSSYGMLVFARIVVGCGEAPLITLTFAFVDDVAPIRRKTLWFGILGVWPVLGTAAGYVLAEPLVAGLGWRGTFFLEAGLAVPLIAFALLMPAVRLNMSPEPERLHDDPTAYSATLLGGGEPSGSPMPSVPIAPLAGAPVDTEEAKASEDEAEVGAAGSNREAGRAARLRGLLRRMGGFVVDVGRVIKLPAASLNNFGYAPVQWMVGLTSFWGPKAVKELFQLEGSEAELIIGAITVVAGIVGTLAGGLMLDAFGSSLRNGFLIQSASTALALLFMQLCYAQEAFAGFCVLLALGLTAMFTAQAPSYAMSCWTVPAAYRPMSQAVITLLGHFIGDVPSPPLTGGLQDHLHNWRQSLAIASSYLAFSVILFGCGVLLCQAGRGQDFRSPEERGVCAERQAGGAARVHEEVEVVSHGGEGGVHGTPVRDWDGGDRRLGLLDSGDLDQPLSANAVPGHV